MELTELYNNYFSERKMKNAFLYFNEIPIKEIDKWVIKSKNEINRIVNLVLSLEVYESVLPEKETSLAIHESIANCFTAVIYNLFNIFNITTGLTGNNCSFFDNHIFDYFNKKQNLTEEEKKQLTFFWHKPVSEISGYIYYRDLKLHVFDLDGKSGFQIFDYNSMEPQITNPFDKREPIIPSVDFFLLHLLYLLWSTELIAKYLFLEICPDKDYHNLFTFLVKKSELSIPIEKIKRLLVAYSQLFAFK